MPNRILAPFFVFIYCCFLSEEYCCSSPFGYENVIQIMKWIIAWLLVLYVGAVFLYEKEGETRRETTRSSTTNRSSISFNETNVIEENYCPLLYLFD